MTLLATIVSASVAGAQTGAEESNNPDGLFMTKTVKPDPSGTPNKYMLQLETFVTGVTLPGGKADVMLILDLSDSMNKKDEGQTKTRLENLKEATNKFIDVLSKTDSRISIVTFNESDNTGVKTSPAFITVKENVSSLKALVKSFVATSNTRIDLGAKKGLAAFKAQSDLSENKFCIILTDGVPYMDEYPKYETAELTWQYTYDMKDMGVKVFTIFLGTDGTSKKFTYYDDTFKETYIINVYNFLDGTSSNFPEAFYNNNTKDNKDDNTFNNYVENEWYTYRKNAGGDRMRTKDASYKKTRNETKYFIKVPNPENLEEVFESIAKEVAVSSLPLNADNTTIKDVISSDFKLSSSVFDDKGVFDASKILMYAAECSGQNEDKTYNFKTDWIKLRDEKIAPDMDVALAADNKTLTFSGFDFEKNFVSWTDAKKGGYKLILQIPIVIDPSSKGGIDLPTNTKESGVYYKDKPVSPFEQIAEYDIPTVSCPNIIVVKKGLKAGESAIFNVKKVGDDATVPPVVLVATQGESGDAMAILKIQEPGTYTVEETAWSWAYTVKGESSISKYVPAATEVTVGGYTGTVFEFTNEPKANAPAHGEDNKNNEFFQLK